MSRSNRILAASALAVLVVTVWMLSWVRQQTLEDLERSIHQAAQSFEANDVLHGPGGNTLVAFVVAERLADRACQSPYISDVVITKRTNERDEHPVLPYKLWAEARANWHKRLEGWRRIPLGKQVNQTSPFGYLYLDLDRSIVNSMNWALIYSLTQ